MGDGKGQFSRPPDGEKVTRNRHNLVMRVVFVAFLAMIQLFLIANLLNGSTHSSTVIKITYTRDAIRTAAHHTSSFLLTAIEDFQSLQESAGIVTNPQREQKIRDLFESEGKDDSRMDPSLLCKNFLHTVFAEKSRVGVEEEEESSTGDPVFQEPLAMPTSRTIVMTTYFSSRTDPTRCWMHSGGHLPRNTFSVIKPWYDAVERLGLLALVFHDDSLSAEYASGSQTQSALFQKVKLRRSNWSLDDERWAVYGAWLRSPAATGVEFVLHIDALEAVIAHDPFQLIAGRSGGMDNEYTLWVHSREAERRDIDGSERCLVHEEVKAKAEAEVHSGPFLVPGDQCVDSAVVGGSKSSFERLASMIVSELEGIYSGHTRRGTRDAWSCHSSVLNSMVLPMVSGGPHGFSANGGAQLPGEKIFSGGYPFCGSTNECIQDGICDHAVYINSH